MYMQLNIYVYLIHILIPVFFLEQDNIVNYDINVQNNIDNVEFHEEIPMANIEADVQNAAINDSDLLDDQYEMNANEEINDFDKDMFYDALDNKEAVARKEPEDDVNVVHIDVQPAEPLNNIQEVIHILIL